MSAVHNAFAKTMFSTEHWRQAGASQGNGGNAVVLAGMSQWGSAVRRHAGLLDQHRGAWARCRRWTA